MIDDQKAQACAAAFKPLAEMGRILNPAALGPLYEAAKAGARLDEDCGEQFVSSDLGLWLRDTFPCEYGGLSLPISRERATEGVANMCRSALTLAEQPGEAKVKPDARTWAVYELGDRFDLKCHDAAFCVTFDQRNVADAVCEHLNDYATLSAQLAAMREVLAEIEWKGKHYDLAGDSYSCCPVCRADADLNTHKPGCTLAAALGVK